MAFGDITADDVGSALHPLFMALGSSPSNAPLASLPQAMQIAAQQQRGGMSRSALKALLIQKGYTPEQAELYSASEATAKLAIQDKQQKELLGDGGGAEPSLFGGGVPTGAPAISPSAPPGPAAGASMNGGTGAPPLSGTGAEIQTKFVDSLKAGGLTNPFGLGAVAAYAQHESRYDPKNINGQWSDPSERGQPGTSGGILSWRDDRLNRMRTFTQGAEDPVAAQAQFTLKENPALTTALQNAKSPEEANALMADAWKFAGYNRTDGGEYAARLATTRSYAGRFLGADGQRPVQVADASGAMPAAPVSGMNPAIGMPNGRPQVANNEQETQSLEGRMGMYPPSVYGVTPQTQASTTSPADMPAFDAQPAGFVIPPGATAAVERQVGAPPTPVNPNIGPTTQRAQAIANFNYWGKRLRASAAFGEAGKGLMEEAKIKMGLAQKFIEPAEAERLADAAGLSGQLRADAISGAIPGNAPTAERKDFEYGQRTPGYEDYQKRMKEAGRSQVSIDQRAGGKFEEGLGTKAAERFNGYIEQGDAAKRRLGDVGILRDASRSLGSLGKSADARAAIGPYAEALGIKIEGLPDIQVFQSTAARLAPQLREPGAGATSDRDLAGFEKAIGQLSATPEAREKILDVFEAASRNQVTAAKIARDVSSGRMTRQEGEDKLQNLPDPLVAFREYQKASGQTAAPQQGAERAAPAAQPTMPTGNTTERAGFITQSRAAAAAALAKRPEARDAILKRLKDAGIYTDGL